MSGLDWAGLGWTGLEGINDNYLCKAGDIYVLTQSGPALPCLDN